MGVVFIVFIAGTLKIAQVIMEDLPELGLNEINWQEILTKVNIVKVDIMDILLFRVIIFVLLILWIYSIIDAFISGIKIERERKQI